MVKETGLHQESCFKESSTTPAGTTVGALAELENVA